MQEKVKLHPVSSGTVTSPLGFFAGAIHAGVKYEDHDHLDLGLLYSEEPCSAAGVFTRNRIKSAPVLLSQEHIASGIARAVVVNSGCANACTGERGMSDARDMACLTAGHLGISNESVLVASTGVVGTPLPLKRIGEGISRITLSREAGHNLARAMMTTDTVPKETAVSVKSHNKEYKIGGVAKGSGMIHPDMATLLCFLTTDARVEPAFLRQALSQAVDVSFNMVTVDGDTSPSDMVLLLANGLAGGESIKKSSGEGRVFQRVLDKVCINLARKIARDGEGATRIIEVSVKGAKTLSDARLAARTIASSPLVKSAVYGCDPNWGRIVVALGRSGAFVDESRMVVYLGDVCVFERGIPQDFDEEKAVELLKAEEVKLDVELNFGDGKATAWGCDLTPEYVTINSAYTT